MPRRIALLTLEYNPDRLPHELRESETHQQMWQRAVEVAAKAFLMAMDDFEHIPEVVVRPLPDETAARAKAMFVGPWDEGVVTHMAIDAVQGVPVGSVTEDEIARLGKEVLHAAMCIAEVLAGRAAADAISRRAGRAQG